MKMKIASLFKRKKSYSSMDKIIDTIKMWACECAWRDDESNTCYVEDKIIGSCDKNCPFWRN